MAYSFYASSSASPLNMATSLWNGRNGTRYHTFQNFSLSGTEVQNLKYCELPRSTMHLSRKRRPKLPAKQHYYHKFGIGERSLHIRDSDYKGFGQNWLWSNGLEVMGFTHICLLCLRVGVTLATRNSKAGIRGQTGSGKLRDSSHRLTRKNNNAAIA